MEGQVKFFKRIYFTCAFKKLRRTYSRKVAKELVSVQPMRNFTKEQIELFFYSNKSMGWILYEALGVPKEVIQKIQDDCDRKRKEMANDS